MSELKYTEDHEWIRQEEDGSLTFGITDHAQDSLGDVVFVELPEAGQTLNAGEEVAVIESVKAAGEIKLPVSGTVIEVNDALSDKPELVNSDPLGEGWFFRLKPDDTSALDDLMDEEQYKAFIE
ncbi:MAG: glycine cleavage system protein GcvH [Gammaproteobacteria bacterium]